MNFDHIIMNPPYGKNLHLKILREAMKHSNNVVNLSPIRWLQDPLAEYKKNSDWKKFEDIRSKIENMEEVPNGIACSMFDAEIAMNLGIYHITPKGGWHREIKWYEKIAIKCWLEKRTIVHHWTGHYKGNFTGNFVKLPLLHGHPGQPDWYEITPPDKSYCFTKPDKDIIKSPTVNFAAKEEAENFWATLQTKFYKFINVKCRCTTELPFECFPWLDDYTHHWTDSELYKYFDLTKDEIKEIEKEMSEYNCN